jgi:acetoin utilization deacetylase AcuC-like enzyme
LKYHQRVLYLDIDIHHGDGVQVRKIVLKIDIFCEKIGKLMRFFRRPST